jgi:hypothetical protein
MQLAGDAHFVAVLNAVACVWWGVFLAWSHSRGEFYFGRLQPATLPPVPPLTIARAARPTAYWSLFSIFGGGSLLMGFTALRVFFHPF